MGIKINFKDTSGNPQLFEEGHALIGFPFLYGEHNNWKPQRMYTIEEFCYIMDAQKPDILKNLKRSGLVN